jgi:septal ring factor EnvC (AmiA/AmiB activator)
VDLVDQEAFFVMIPLKSRLVKTIGLLLTMAVPLVLAVPVHAQTLDDTVNAQAAADQAAAESQDRINEIREKTQDAAAKYAQALAETESMEKYNEQLGSQVADQQKEMESIERQLVEIETTNREVQPLMQKWSTRCSVLSPWMCRSSSKNAPIA